MTITHHSTHTEFLTVIRQAIKFVNTTMDEDRVEFDVFNVQVKVWRTKINTKMRFHVGWKFDWEDQYHETTCDQLAYFLYNYFTTGPRVPEPKGGWHHGRPSHPADVSRNKFHDIRRRRAAGLLNRQDA